MAAAAGGSARRVHGIRARPARATSLPREPISPAERLADIVIARPSARLERASSCLLFRPTVVEGRLAGGAGPSRAAVSRPAPRWTRTIPPRGSRARGLRGRHRRDRRRTASATTGCTSGRPVVLVRWPQGGLASLGHRHRPDCSRTGAWPVLKPARASCRDAPAQHALSRGRPPLTGAAERRMVCGRRQPPPIRPSRIIANRFSSPDGLAGGRLSTFIAITELEGGLQGKGGARLARFVVCPSGRRGKAGVSRLAPESSRCRASGINVILRKCQ